MRKDTSLMLKVTFLELFLRFIPESFIIIIAGYILSTKIFNPKLVCISTAILSVIVYLIRLLPIQFGVHTLLEAAAAVFLLITVNKIYVKGAVFSVFTFIIIEGIFEIANMIFIQNLLKIDINSIITHPAQKVIWFTPSLLITAFAVYVVGVFLNKYKSVNE